MAKIKTDGYGNYKADAAERDLILGSLPAIRGAWYFVDPTSGLAANDGLSPGSAKATIVDAYDLCASGAGDGIVLMSAGTTTAGCTSYLSAAIAWSKHGITVVGLSSGTRMGSRARIANAAAAVALTHLITVSGNNNRFVNVHMWNGGSDVAAVGCLIVSGLRNAFENCHFVGAGHATPAVGACDLKIDGGEENTFERCTFGTDSIIRAAANGNIAFDGGGWRNRFYDCDIVSHSDTAGKGAIISADATAFSGVQVFARCRFLNWNVNGIGTSDSAFIGTKPNSGNILIDSCSLVGWAAWDSVAGNDTVYIANSHAVASGAGGIATAP
jgi:hypothetical protein